MIDFLDDQPKRLELGCGRNRIPDCIGIDRLDLGQEIVRPFERGIPFNDNTFDEIFAHHSMEHLDRRDVKFVWEEIYRVLKIDGIFNMVTPHDKSPQASMPEHLSFWNPQVVEVLCNQWGSEDHHTITNFEILQNEIKGEELHVILKAKK